MSWSGSRFGCDRQTDKQTDWQTIIGENNSSYHSVMEATMYPTTLDEGNYYGWREKSVLITRYIEVYYILQSSCGVVLLCVKWVCSWKLKLTWRLTLHVWECTLVSQDAVLCHSTNFQQQLLLFVRPTSTDNFGNMVASLSKVNRENLSYASCIWSSAL